MKVIASLKFLWYFWTTILLAIPGMLIPPLMELAARQWERGIEVEL